MGQTLRYLNGMRNAEDMKLPAPAVPLSRTCLINEAIRNL